MVSRKQFLQLSTLGFGALFIPSFLFSKKNESFNPSLYNVNVLLKNAKNFRLEKKWTKAKNLYLQIIQDYPQEARAYDGLRKCIFQQPKQENAYLQILENAVNQYPNNKELQHRLISQYTHIALGNRKLSKQKNSNLLLSVQQKLSALAAQYPNDLSIQKQLIKVNNSVSSNSGAVHFKQNTALRQLHKQNQKLHNKRFDVLTNDQIYSKLTLLKNKTYNKEREKHIRELYLILIKRNIKVKDYNQAIIYSKEYYNLYPSDRSAIYWMRRLGKTSNNPQMLLQTEEKNHQSKNNFWSASSYFTSLKKNQPSNVTKMQQLLFDMDQKKTDEHQDLIFKSKKIDLFILQNQTAQAEIEINALIQSKEGIRNTSIIDSINILIIKHLKNTQQTDLILKFPYIIINAKELLDSSNPWEKKIAWLNQNRSFSKSIYLEKLQKFISKM